MPNFLFLIFSGVFFVLIQSNLFLNNFIFPVKPDLTIPLIVYIGLSREPVQGSILVLGIGCFMDIFSAGVMGLYALMGELMFFLIYVLRKVFFLKNKLFCCLLIVVFFLMESFLICIYFKFTGRGFPGDWDFFEAAFMRAVFTLFLCFFIFPLVYKTEKLFKNSI